MNDVTALIYLVVNIDDLVRSHRVGDALHINVSALLTGDLVFDESVGLVRNKNFAGRSVLFESAREIYTTADDGVVHPVLAAEISDGAEACVNSSPTTWRLF